MNFKVETVVNIDIMRVADLLCGAFEGGSNCWYEIIKNKSVKGTPVNDQMAKEWNRYFHVAYPLSKGGSLCIVDYHEDEEDREEFTLNLASIENGLSLWASERPQDFVNFISENDDASTSDTFLQYCLFGEIVF